MQHTRRWFVRGLAAAPLAHSFITNAAATPPPGGSLSGVPAALLPAFTAGPDDLPLPPPGRGDWLASHDEPGQTFRQFQSERQHKPTATRRKIAIKPLGDLPATAPLAAVMDFAGRFFGLPITKRLSGKMSAIQGVKSRIQEGRNQYMTPSILDALIPLVPTDAYCMLAVTNEDLYPGPDWNFVFGEARFFDRVGVYSFARYDPAFHDEPYNDGTDKLILRRCLKLMVHEIGHMFSLAHCIYYSCVFNGSNSLEETDRSPLHPCPVCLRKLHDSIGFDVTEREQRLAEFLDKHDLIPEAETAQRRHARLLAAR